jgi:hypothetical protein
LGWRELPSAGNEVTEVESEVIWTEENVETMINAKYPWNIVSFCILMFNIYLK